MIILSLVAVVYAVLFKLIVTRKIRPPFIGSHGQRTLLNGASNVNTYTLTLWLFMLLNFILDKSSGTNLSYYNILNFLADKLWYLVLLAFSASSLYRFSEVKHLSDGISINRQTNNFFVLYSLSGIIHFIFPMIIIFCFEDWSVADYFIFFLILILLFLAGMGDLFQTIGINRMNLRRYGWNQTIRAFIDIPMNFYRVIFNQTRRINFYHQLRFSLIHIALGTLRIFR